MRVKTRHRAGMVFGAATVGIAVAFVNPTPAFAACNNNANSVCIGYDSRGYDASFLKRSGSAVYVDFNLHCNNGRWFGDDGPFTATAPNNYTYTFAVGSQGTCHVRLINPSNGAELARSPDLTR